MRYLLANQRLVASLVVAGMLSACGGNKLVKSVAPTPNKQGTDASQSSPSQQPSQAPSQQPSQQPSRDATKSSSTSDSKDDKIVIDTSEDDAADAARVKKPMSLEERYASNQATAAGLQESIADFQQQLEERRDEQGSLKLRASTAFGLFMLGAPSYAFLKRGDVTLFKADFVAPHAVVDGYVTDEVTSDEIKAIKKEWDAVAHNAPNRSPIPVVIDGNKVMFASQGELESFVHNEQRARGFRDVRLSQAKAARLQHLEKLFFDQKLRELTAAKAQGYAIYVSKVAQAEQAAARTNEARKVRVSSANGKVAMAVGVMTLVTVLYGANETYEWTVTRAEANRLETLVLPNLQSDLADIQESIKADRRELAKSKGEVVDSNEFAPGQDPITQGDSK
jgi:hypothetical protein